VNLAFSRNLTLWLFQTLDVQAEVDKVNVDLSSVEVYSTSLKTQLSDLKDAVNISFSEFYSEVSISRKLSEIWT
jgi:hypothetical protein